MKFALVIFALVAVASAASTRSLTDDLQDIVAVIPVGELRVIVCKYIDTDPEVQEVVTYLQGDEWEALVEEVRTNPTWIAYKEYLADTGLDIETIIQAIRDLISRLRRSHKSATARGIRGLIDELREAFPTDTVLAVVDVKLNSNPDSLKLLLKIVSETTHAFVEEIRAIPEVQRLAQELRDRGFDVDTAIDVIYGILGWSR